MRSRVLAVLTGLTLVATASFGIVWLSEARRHASHGRELEGDVARLEQRAAITGEERDAARTDVATRDARIAFLEAELVTAIGRAEEVTRAVDERRAELERLRGELDERRIAAGRPMPEGVRLALAALEDCLRDDGHDGLRFVQARELQDRELRDVELIETAFGGRSVTYHRAAKLTVELDRETGLVILRLGDGHVLRDGVLEELPEAGLELRFEGAYGRTWEQRLPYLVRAAGAYPEDPERSDRVEVLDALTRDRWRRRLGLLFEAAQTGLRFEIGRFRTVRDGRLVDVSLHGYDGRHLLMQSAEVARLAVEVDRDAGVVSLLLEDGVLRMSGGETTIPASGYRILLPGVTPGQAVDAMLGFVVER